MTDEKKPGTEPKTVTPSDSKRTAKAAKGAKAIPTEESAAGPAGATEAATDKPAPGKEKVSGVTEPSAGSSELDLLVQGGGDRAGGPPPTKPGRSRGNGAGILALLLLLVLTAAALAGGWWFWERQQALERAQADFASTLELAELRESAIARAERLAGRVDNLAAEHQAHVQSLASAEAAMADIRDNQARASSRMERLEALAAAHRQDWILSEVDYLFGIAAQRLRFRGDVDGALAALRDADTLLARLGADTIDQRRQVRRAVDALLEVRQPDRAALAAELGDLIDAVDGWAVTQPITRVRTEPMAGQPDADLTSLEGWRQAGARAWQQLTNSLASLVVVRRDDPVPPLVSPKQTWFLRENLRLQLQVARVALLERESETYRSSLDQADAWLERHFRGSDAEVQNARDTLRRLSDVELDPVLPDLAELLSRIRPEREDDA
ncbi:MAG: uroporphyrinogen-III C-methyltransferase [Aquisalimonadaceae bacterium]